MSSEQLLITITHRQLTNKLHTILQTLRQEQIQLRDIYRSRIQELQMDIFHKQNQLDQIKLQIVCFQDKCQKYERTLNDKNKLIDQLNKKVTSMHDFVKQKLYCFIDQFDLSCTSIENSRLRETFSTIQQSDIKYHNHLQKCLQKCLQKQQQIKNKINISQYFMKSIQNSQGSTKNKTTHGFDTPSQHSNSVSYLKNKNQLKIQSDPYLSVSAYTSTPKLQKVKSLQQFRKKSLWNSQAPKNDKNNKIQIKDDQNYNQFHNKKKNSLNSQQYLVIHTANTNKQPQIKRKISQISPSDQKIMDRDKQRAIHKEKLKILALEPKNVHKYSPRHHQFMQKWKKVSAFQYLNNRKQG